MFVLFSGILLLISELDCTLPNLLISPVVGLVHCGSFSFLFFLFFFSIFFFFVVVVV